MLILLNCPADFQYHILLSRLILSLYFAENGLTSYIRINNYFKIGWCKGLKTQDWLGRKEV